MFYLFSFTTRCTAMAISARLVHAREKPSALTPHTEMLNNAEMTAKMNPNADNPIKTHINVRMT